MRRFNILAGDELLGTGCIFNHPTQKIAIIVWHDGPPLLVVTNLSLLNNLNEVYEFEIDEKITVNYIDTYETKLVLAA